jgi:hypothetical protein
MQKKMRFGGQLGAFSNAAGTQIETHFWGQFRTPLKPRALFRRTMRIGLWLSIFSAVSVLSAQAQLLDDGLSPRERSEQGWQLTGPHSAYQSLYCSQSARQKFIPQALAEDQGLKTLNDGRVVTVREELNLIHAVLNKAFTALESQGDSTVQGKNICTGFYFEEKSHLGNALSLTQGYLIFDYRLFQRLYDLPEGQRSFWVYDFVVLHEFAHQLQYWNEDVEVVKTLSGLQSSRVPELAADCAAAGMLRLAHPDLSDELFDLSFQGVMGAAQALGDFEFDDPTHHGTPLERTFAASYGAGLVRRSSPVGLAVTSRFLLNSCNQFIRDHLDF